MATTFSLTLLFLRTPLIQAIGAFPPLINARVAFDKISALDLAEHFEAFGHSSHRHDWQVLALEQVT